MLEDKDAVGQMVADWLRPNWDDEDDFAPEEAPATATRSAIGTCVDGDAAWASPVTLVTAPDGSAEANPQDDQSANTRARKAG